ncbi:MAG: hypothetical protein LBR48_05085 [Dysgonamonadaceae bacterium]|jgi:hypothetical protein|nr:hypothetical protein [Dysgonamonadaceae bacterium]
MRTLLVIFIALTAIVENFSTCQTQGEKNKADKSYQKFVDKFADVSVPVNFKKMKLSGVDMTIEEATRFMGKSEKDLHYEVYLPYITEDGKEGEDTEMEENLPGCVFKYNLNDSINILCTVELKQGDTDTTFVALNSFSLNGQLIDRCAIVKEIANIQDCSSFILLDKTHLRIFYYKENSEQTEGTCNSTCFYKNYEITNTGKFIEKDKSDIMCLKKSASSYCSYNKDSDDPMNEYQ